MRIRTALALGVIATLLITPGAIANHEGRGEPNEGSLFQLFGSAQDDVDPENPFNEVISVDTTLGQPGGVNRTPADKVKVVMLDNQLEFKYYFVGRTCSAGSPRIVVIIDVDGRGKNRDLVLDGHSGVPPTLTGCPPNVWQYEDTTDNLPRWDVRALTAGSQPPGTQPNVYLPWDTVEGLVTAAFPNHRVVLLRLVDDSGAFDPAARGCAYYDIVSLGARTLSDWSDTRRHRPRTPNTC